MSDNNDEIIYWKPRVKKDPMNLTPCQIKILRFIDAFTDTHDYAPTLQDIALAQKTSTITSLEHLNALERKGMITRRSNEARSIQLTPCGVITSKLGSVTPMDHIHVEVIDGHAHLVFPKDSTVTKRYIEAVGGGARPTLRTLLKSIPEPKPEEKKE